MEEQQEHRSKSARFRKMLTKEKPLVHLGPFYLVRSPWQYVVLGWILAAGIIWMTRQVDGLPADTALLGHWCSERLLMSLSVVIGLLFSFRLKVRGKAGFVLSTLIFALAPFAAYNMVELFNGEKAFERGLAIVFMNVLAYGLVYLFFLVIFGNYRWAVLFGTGLLYLFAAACYFIMIFRGTPFVPLDILSSGTAANVADNYVFELSWSWTIATVQCGLIMGMGFQLGSANLKRVRWKLTLRALAVLLVVGIVSVFFSGAYLQEKGYAISYWNQQESYEQYGQWLAFCLNLRNVYPEKPENYKADEVGNIITSLLVDDDISPTGDTAYNMLTGEKDYTPSDTTPNIIMIMNESFSDLQSLGKGFKTNIDVTPFFDSLEENTIRGNLQVSVVGGGTACTEYEALTGNAQRFLPSGAVAYSANIHDNTPSMVWTLRELGYQTEAFHPYYISGWNRESAYQYLGFEDTTFIEDILPEEMLEMTSDDRMEAVESIDPKDGDVYNRDYMSDHYNYKLLEDLYEARNTAEPFFLFNVTIQNHGGYADGFPNFKESVRILDMDGDYPQAERYLSLMHASDQAFEELIDYFKNVEEPTIIVMFGDHQPSVEQEFYEELYDGKSLDELSEEELLSRFQTPFVIWANYDIPEKNIGSISANYLSTLIMETAGVELPEYNRYLASLYARLPVISNVGFKDAQGDVSYSIEDTQYESLLNDYQCVAYNNLLDYSGRDWSLFTLEGDTVSNDR